MERRKFKQSDYMSIQLMEIERFRMTLAQNSHAPISFQEAVMLWITEGYAEEFKSNFSLLKDQFQPALA